jgi:acylphosphatase
MTRMILGFTLIACSALSFAIEYNLPGFVTEIEDGRLWVFKKDSKELEEFKKHGEPAKQFTNIGAGPNGMTVKSADQGTLDEYLKAYQNQ